MYPESDNNIMKLPQDFIKKFSFLAAIARCLIQVVKVEQKIGYIFGGRRNNVCLVLFSDYFNNLSYSIGIGESRAAEFCHYWTFIHVNLSIC